MCLPIIETGKMTTSKTAGELNRGRRSRRQTGKCESTELKSRKELSKTIESKDFVMSSFHELQDLFLLNFVNCTIDDNEISVLYEEFMPTMPTFHSKNKTGFNSKR